MDRDQHDGQVNSTQNESERSPAKPTGIKQLRLVREVIRVSSHLHAGEGCLDTYHSTSAQSVSHTD